MHPTKTIGAGLGRELCVTWTGHYAWPGFERDGLPALPNRGGVYLLTFERGDEFLIYASGETGDFRKRFAQHAREYRRGESNVLDVDQAQTGVRSEVWHGWGWTPEKRAEYARREVEIQTAVTRELAAIRIFLSNDLPRAQTPRGGDHPPPLCGRRAFARPQYVRPSSV